MTQTEGLVTSGHFERKSDVDGFTVIWRRNRSPKVHLLRSWGECNVEQARKKGTPVDSIEGSRENLLDLLGGRRAAWCHRCFPTPDERTEITPELVYADPVEAE